MQIKDIAWITGAAGAGKSAIGRSICERCAEEGTLLASFFFGSNDSTRSHSRSLVATLAYQICSLNSAIRQAISNAIDHDPLIFTRSLRTQFSSLVISPLFSTFANEPHSAPCLIVIDGLDECQDIDSQRNVLDTILYASTLSQIPLRFLVCSRPENQIVNFFSSQKAQDTLFRIFLGEEYSPMEDIKLYLWDRFKAIKEGHIFKSMIPSTWPREAHVERIAWQSSGQFIYAATVVLYVESSHYRPHQRLDAVLGLHPPFKDLPFAELDALYKHILDTAEDQALVVDILMFPVIYHAMDMDTIEEVLALEEGEVEVLLSYFGSIVQISGMHGKVSLLHKSFSDFLLDARRSGNLSKGREETRAWHILRLIQIHTGQ